MFTGIIEEVGKIKNIKNGALSSVLTVEAEKVTEDTNIGDSIAVNGVCLTVIRLYNYGFDADVMAETMRRSGFKNLSAGDFVNLERAVKAGGRFGGHIVSGHVDGVGNILSMKKEDNAVWVTVGCGREILRYIVEKGSVALDGISLTVAFVNDSCFAVSVIPHTGTETILLKKRTGDIVNIECDVIGKYVDKLLHFESNEKKSKSPMTMDFLYENGFL